MDKGFKVLRIDHVAVAVNNNNAAAKLFKLLGMSIGENEFIETEKVNVLKAKPENKDHTIELLEASDESSVVRKFISKRGEGLHHIALEVDSVSKAIKYLLDNNIDVIYKTPKVGAGNKLITFIDPKSTPGILLELCQPI